MCACVYVGGYSYVLLCVDVWVVFSAYVCVKIHTQHDKLEDPFQRGGRSYVPM